MQNALVIVLSSLAADAEPTPAATSYAEAIGAGMGILLAICAAVWFVMKLVNDPIKEKLKDAASRAAKVELELEGVKRDVANGQKDSVKLESDLKDKVERLTATVDKLNDKMDALMLVSKGRANNKDPRES